MQGFCVGVYILRNAINYMGTSTANFERERECSVCGVAFDGSRFVKESAILAISLALPRF